MKSDNIGILDPMGLKKNPLTKKKYSKEYLNFSKNWKKLPAYAIAKQAIEDIKKNQVILIISGTGSGKTVLFPKFALHSKNYDTKIAITFPKRDIAKSSAEYAALTLDVEIGQEVGYQFRGARAISEDTKLLYATDGTIVARLLKDPLLEEFDMVIVDEAHERKIQIDFLLYLLKQTLKARPDFKIIIMSATVDPTIFSDYYNEFKFKKIEIGGKTNYPIKSIFANQELTYEKALKYGFDKLIDILKSSKNDGDSNDIIFFVTSSNEAKNMCKKLDLYMHEKESDKCDITCNGNIYCVSIYSTSSNDSKEIAKDKSKYKTIQSSNGKKYYRKVVIATNIAESSLTIDGVKYVIDTGHELSSFYDPKCRSRKLMNQMISQAQVKQRMGRSGRTSPGICYHIYSEESYNKMIKFPKPSI